MQLKIGKFRCGSRAGTVPPLLLASIFYDGQNMVLDHQNGIFDRDKALAQIRLAEESSERFQIPVAMDVLASTPMAMRRYLEFVCEFSQLPFVIDSSVQEPRLEGLKFCSENNLLDRAIYNSIGEDSLDEELQALAEYPAAAVILMGINQDDYSPAGTIQLLEELLPSLRRRKIGNLMVDVCVLDQVSLKSATEIAQTVKEKLSLPVGGAPCNGVYMWEALKTLPPALFETGLASTIAYATSRGFDFAFSGPVKSIGKSAVAVSVAAVYDGYALRQKAWDLPESHPLNTQF